MIERVIRELDERTEAYSEVEFHRVCIDFGVPFLPPKPDAGEHWSPSTVRTYVRQACAGTRHRTTWIETR